MNELTDEKTLVIYRRNGCLGCIYVSKLLDFIDTPDARIIACECDNTKEKYPEFGIKSTPLWAVFEHGEKLSEMNPASDREALFRFLNETARIEILRLFFDMQLDLGREYADRMQDVFAELIVRKQKEDANAIISATRLKVMKACMSKSYPEREECIDQVLNRIHVILKERMSEPDGDTEVRRKAIEELPRLKEELLNYTV
ncbi:hypothetical protein BXO88_02705 [Oribacterium sp. C9]|nr:hypothetical protein BXO88_02705 [Oribacterium sp. C9]